MGKIFIAQERYGFNTLLIFPMITSATSNTKDVTKFISTGDLVEIHGATGVVRKLGGAK